MAKKYIDAERFVEYFGDWHTEEGTELGYVGPIKDLVFRMPAADVVEVVRCKECKWFGDIGCAIRIVDDSDRPSENDFCSFAERKDNG